MYYLPFHPPQVTCNPCLFVLVYTHTRAPFPLNRCSIVNRLRVFTAEGAESVRCPLSSWSSFFSYSSQWFPSVYRFPMLVASILHLPPLFPARFIIFLRLWVPGRIRKRREWYVFVSHAADGTVDREWSARCCVPSCDQDSARLIREGKWVRMRVCGLSDGMVWSLYSEVVKVRWVVPSQCVMS